MKKRICFVGFADDQSEALQVLKQAMANSHAPWEYGFVPNGPKALMLMATESFDAVITNMHMPGMNGAELLQQVGTLHPRTLRFVVGNVADQEYAMSCIGGTHHFIAQPCRPETLISTIQRGLAIDAWLYTDQLRALVPKLRRLPALPLTYFEVLKRVESPNASVQSIGEVIARDPAATVKLLQMVNSAAFSLDQKVSDPIHAVSLLGMETVKSLVLCLQVFSPNDQAKKAGLSFDQLWDHSFTVANLAREIVALQKGGPRMANDAFTAGLLHDVGRIILASNLPEEYGEAVAVARKKSKPLHEAETEKFGVTHGQVGAYLLGLWGMPAPLVEAAALHHTPGNAFSQEFSILTAVHAANVFAYEKYPRTDGMVPPLLDFAYIETLGLKDTVSAWRKALVTPKPAPVITQTLPAPVKSQPQPVPAKPQPAPAPAPVQSAPVPPPPVKTQPQPVAAKPQPTPAPIQPAPVKPQPAPVVAPPPVVVPPAPAPAQPAPVAVQPEPVQERIAPIEPEPVESEPEPEPQPAQPVFTGLSIGTMHKALPIQKPVPMANVPRRNTRPASRILIPAGGVLAFGAIVWWLASGGAPQRNIPVEARRPAAREPIAPINSANPTHPARPAPAIDNTAALAAIATAQAQSNAVALAMANQQRFDSIKVQAIFYRPVNATVMINGKTLGLRERINGIEVVRITQTNVVLAIGSEQRDFQLKAP